MKSDARTSHPLRRKLASILRWPALLLVALLLCGWISVAPLARRLLETRLCQTLGTTVSVAAMDLRIFAGDSRLDRIIIQNPPGFTEAPVLVLEALRWSLPLVALASPDISVPSLTIQQIDIALDMKEADMNIFCLLQTARDRMARRSMQEQGSYPGRRRIERVSIERIRVEVDGSLTTSGQDGVVTFDGDQFELARSQYTLDELAEEILSILVKILFKNSIYLELNEKASASFSRSLELPSTAPAGGASTAPGSGPDGDAG
ncbi:MAG: hypothetical protein JXA90_13680 [Planctomycetes bacterium]|nr:hypothetical protein [Planctomycetota bacterium]